MLIPSKPWVRLPLRSDLILQVRRGLKTVTRRMERRDGRPPCAVGDTIAFTEGLMAIGTTVVYQADRNSVFVDGSSRTWRWKPRALAARYCPDWAVRTWATVRSVTRPRLVAMDTDEARREGFHGERPTHDLVRVWVQMHGSWDPTARPWRIAFDRVVMLSNGEIRLVRG